MQAVKKQKEVMDLKSLFTNESSDYKTIILAFIEGFEAGRQSSSFGWVKTLYSLASGCVFLSLLYISM